MLFTTCAVTDSVTHCCSLIVCLVSSVFQPPFWKSTYRHISVKNHRISWNFIHSSRFFELDERHVIKNEKVALDRHWVRQNVFFIYVKISVISAWFCEHARQPNILVVLLWCYSLCSKIYLQSYKTVCNYFDSIWAPLTTTLTSSLCNMTRQQHCIRSSLEEISVISAWFCEHARHGSSGSKYWWRDVMLPIRASIIFYVESHDCRPETSEFL